MADMVKLAGLWKQAKDGKTHYLSGNLGPGVKILVFVNKFKKEDKHPDYVVYLAPVEKKGTGSEPSPDTGEDIPF